MAGYRPPIPVDTVRDIDLCSLCRHIPLRPHQSRCGHLFCALCISKYLEGYSSRQCPDKDCQEECKLSEMNLDKNAMRRMAGHLVSCCLKAEGCEWSGVFSDYEAHLTICGVDRIRCTLAGCDLIVCRSTFDAHRQNCIFRKVLCQVCLQRVVALQRPFHDAFLCHKIPFPIMESSSTSSSSSCVVRSP